MPQNFGRVIPNTENTTLTDKFYSKVYEGLFRDTKKWMKDYERITKSKGLIIKKHYMWYTTCPKMRQEVRQKLYGGGLKC